MFRVLVTGAAGFIGSNTVRRCLDAGWDVTGVDDLSNGRIEFLHKGASFFPVDFTHDAIVTRVQKGAFDAIIHLAAVPRVSYSVEHPIETNDVNVTKTLKLLNYARGNVGRVVFASSSSVYGGAEQLPTPETAPKNPKSPYALQKSIIEDYLRLYSELYGLDSACMRFFNVFGENALGSSPYATAVSAWLTAIKQGVPLRSDGTGEQTRDMCYVDNVVDACMRAATHSSPLSAQCFNVACGDSVSNNRILAYLSARYPNLQVQNAPARAGDVMHTRADISKIGQVLGYVPLVRFWEGLDRTIEWFETNWDTIMSLKLNT